MKRSLGAFVAIAIAGGGTAVVRAGGFVVMAAGAGVTLVAPPLVARVRVLVRGKGIGGKNFGMSICQSRSRPNDATRTMIDLRSMKFFARYCVN